MYLNKAFIIGNVTRDPELRSIPSGTQVTTFSVATNRVWKNREGQKQEDTQFHNVVVFGRQAEIVAQYLKKGGSVMVEGRMQTRSWDAGDGTKKYRTEIVADRVQFGPRRDAPSQGQGGGTGGGYPAEGYPVVEPKSEVPSIEYPEEQIQPEDIPF